MATKTATEEQRHASKRVPPEAESMESSPGSVSSGDGNRQGLEKSVNHWLCQGINCSLPAVSSKDQRLLDYGKATYILEIPLEVKVCRQRTMWPSPAVAWAAQPWPKTWRNRRQGSRHRARASIQRPRPRRGDVSLGYAEARALGVADCLAEAGGHPSTGSTLTLRVTW